MKKLLTAAVFLCSVVLVVSCDSLFSKVEVKASPSLYAPLGGRSIEVSEYVSVEKIADFLGNYSQDSGIKVYDYVPVSGSTAATFLVYYPLMDIPVDFSEYLKQLDLTAGLNASLNDISFTVPELTADTSGSAQTVLIPNSNNYAGQTLNAASAAAVNALIGSSGNITINPSSVSLSGGSSFQSAVIKTGSILLSSVPTVAGLSLDPSGLKITLPGSSDELSFILTSGGDYVVDLAGKTLTAGNFSVNGFVSVSGSVSEGTVVPAKGIGADISCSVRIEEMQSATINFDQNLEVSISKKMPAEVLDLTPEVTFKSNPGLGMDITLENMLPAGMNVIVTLNSAALGISSQSALFPSGTTTSESIANTVNPVLKPSTWANGNLDITAKISFPGGIYDEVAKTLTVSNITAGQTYSLSGSINLLAEFESAEINPNGAASFSGVYPESGDIDLSSVMDKLPDGIGLVESGFEANIYLSSPQSTNTLNVDGIISADYTGTGSSGTTYLFGASGMPESINFGSALSLPAGTSWTGAIPSPSVSFGPKLVSFINSKPQTASLKYSLGLNSVTITAADLAEGKTSIKAEMLLKIPVALKIDGTDDSPADSAKKGVLIDILDIAGVDASKDLFGRSEAGSVSSEINNLLDQLTEMTISVAYTNTLGMEIAAFVEDASTGIKKNIILTQGTNTASVSLNAGEIKSVITSYPFTPTVNLFIPNTPSFGLKKDGGISVNLSVSAVTDINYTYDLRGK